MADDDDMSQVLVSMLPKIPNACKDSLFRPIVNMKVLRKLYTDTLMSLVKQKVMGGPDVGEYVFPAFLQ